jgi:hypothetical protein
MNNTEQCSRVTSALATMIKTLSRQPTYSLAMLFIFSLMPLIIFLRLNGVLLKKLNLDDTHF